MTIHAMSRIYGVSYFWRTAILVLSALATLALVGLVQEARGPRWVPHVAYGVVVVVALALHFAPTRVDLEADGVVIRWLGLSRRLPFREIENATAEVTSETRFGTARRRNAGLEVRTYASLKIVVANGPPVWLRFGTSAGDADKRDRLLAALMRELLAAR